MDLRCPRRPLAQSRVDAPLVASFTRASVEAHGTCRRTMGERGTGDVCYGAKVRSFDRDVPGGLAAFGPASKVRANPHGWRPSFRDVGLAPQVRAGWEAHGGLGLARTRSQTPQQTARRRTEGSDVAPAAVVGLLRSFKAPIPGVTSRLLKIILAAGLPCNQPLER